MHADRVDVSWDAAKSQWLVRIQSGEEVIRRHSNLPSSADDGAIRAAALQMVRDEGYDASASDVTISRAPARASV